MKLRLSVFGLSAPLLVLAGTVGSHLSPSPKAPRKVTYANDVAPILNRACVTCHRPGEVAPFSLAGYENAKKWATMVCTVTQKGVMPPWKAVKGFGEFKGDNRLTSEELETLAEWKSLNMPRGNPRLEPPSVPPAPEWPLGKPDLTLTPSKPYKLSAEGDDVYRNFVIKTNSDVPIWVNGIDVRPGNRKIVHHVIVYIDGARMADELEKNNHDGQEGYTSSGGGVGFFPTSSLGGWAPGIRASATPDGTAFKIPPHANLVVQVHYHKSGKPEEDQTKVGLYFANKPVEKEMQLAWIINFMLDITAGKKDYHIHAIHKVRDDMTLYSLMPHMHMLGKSMKAEVQLPDGSVRPLIYVVDWDFNWQLNYRLKTPMHIPAGSRILVEGVYDNSAENPRNPSSPPRHVQWGEQTTDEMFLLIATYTLDKQNLLAKR